MKNTDVSCGSSIADTSRQYLSCLSTLIRGHVLYRCLINIWLLSTHVSKAVQGTLTVNTGAKLERFYGNCFSYCLFMRQLSLSKRERKKELLSTKNGGHFWCQTLIKTVCLEFGAKCFLDCSLWFSGSPGLSAIQLVVQLIPPSVSWHQHAARVTQPSYVNHLPNETISALLFPVIYHRVADSDIKSKKKK